MLVYVLLCAGFFISLIIAGALVDFDVDTDSHWLLGLMASLGCIFLGAKILDISVEQCFSNMSYLNILYAVACYIAIGIVWSFVRFYSKARKLEEQSKTEYTFNKLKSKVPMWIVFWIPSMVWNLLSDILYHMFEWLSDELDIVYKCIFEKATGRKLNK